MVVSENGDVTAAKVISASPKEAAPVLFEAVMLARFKERPGCGPFKIEFLFNLTDH